MLHKIELVKVSLSKGQFPLIRKLSLAINHGDIVLITGRSGQGKSTLLEIAAGLIVPNDGIVLWDKKCIADMTDLEIVQKRKSLGYVFQHNALISNHTIFDNLALPLKCHFDYDDKEIRRRVLCLMEELNLFNIEKCYPEVLSQSQLRCAAIARALITEPDIVLLDEPLNGIDIITAKGIINVLKKHHESCKMTIVMMTHIVDFWENDNCIVYMLENGSLCQVDHARSESLYQECIG